MESGEMASPSTIQEVSQSGVRARVCFKLVPDREHMKLYVVDLANASVNECGVGALYRKRTELH